MPLSSCFQYVACGVWIAFHLRQCRRQGRASRQQTMTVRIERSERQRFTVFTLSGRMEAEQVTELKKLLDRDCQNIILDLRELRLADRAAGGFLPVSQAG